MSIKPSSYRPSTEERKGFAQYSWRAAGATNSESYLKSLCEQSFLRFWTYAGVHRKDANGIAKEVCDVLVAFDDDIIIFSDKDCSWPTSASLQVNWLRWEKKTILKSVSQLRGAQRLLECEDTKLYLDQQCSIPFPYPLSKVGTRRTHLIAVARGATEKCREYFKGGLGTFAVLCDPNKMSNEPFILGAQPKSQPFVHILDEIALDLLFSTLTTIRDFVAYLSARKEFLTRDNIVAAHGEEDLLALYFSGDNPDPWQGRFPVSLPTSTLLEVPDGLWESTLPFFEHRSQIETVGWLWDEIIDDMIDSITTGQIYFAYPATIGGQERVIRFLAREPRARRILLAQQLFGLIRGTPPNQRTFRTICANNETESTFVYMVVPRHSEVSETKYRIARREMLMAYCQIVKLKYPQIRGVVGIASEPEHPSNKSFDILALDLTDWKDEDVARAEEIRQRTGFMEEVKEWRLSKEEMDSLQTDDVILPGPKAKPYRPKINKNSN